jgi:hypothetical protein
MNTADNVHAFATAEQRKRGRAVVRKALLSVEQACQAKEAPEGTPKVKYPKPKTLFCRYIHITNQTEGVKLQKWLVYSTQVNPVNSDVYVPDPFSGAKQYFDKREDARRAAAYMNTTYKTKKMKLNVYRVAPVTISVSF